MLNPGLWSFRVGCYCAILAFVPTPLMFWFVVNHGMIDRMTLRFPWNHKNLVSVYLSAASYLVTFHHSSSSRVSPGFVACDNAQVCWAFFTRTHGVRRLLLLGCTTCTKRNSGSKGSWIRQRSLVNFCELDYMDCYPRTSFKLKFFSTPCI